MAARLIPPPAGQGRVNGKAPWAALVAQRSSGIMKGILNKRARRLAAGEPRQVVG